MTLPCSGFLSKNPVALAIAKEILSAEHDSCYLSGVIIRFNPGIATISSTL